MKKIDEYPPRGGQDVQEADRPEDIEAAKAMLANPDIGVTQIAYRLGVSPATLYRYIPVARNRECPRRKFVIGRMGKFCGREVSLHETACSNRDWDRS